MRTLSTVALSLVLAACQNNSGEPSAVGQLASDRIELRAHTAEYVAALLELGAPAAALTLCLIGGLTLATLRFKKRLD